MMPAMLDIKNLSVSYGAIEALRDVNLSVEKGSIVAILGANGAGKSTLLKTISGLVKPKSGSITLAGEKNLVGLYPYKIAELGVIQSPEGRRIFPRMTVIENLQMGTAHADPANYAADTARVFAMFPILEERQAQRAGTLSGGEQQMLAIGRALMSRPKLLLLDEPSLGLAPIYIRRIFQIVKELNRDHGMTILLVEQNANQALRVADRGYVLQHGEITLAGTGAELLASPEVRAAYLEGGHA